MMQSPLNPPLAGGSKPRSGFGAGSGWCALPPARQDKDKLAKERLGFAKANPAPKTRGRFRPVRKGRVKEGARQERLVLIPPTPRPPAA
ncbi:hypothetical protein QO014_003722 [Kaistia dalseonensis]|uniref:Uncharacterized protein n=1 Tax=Kaistia dalseonensis TaxID=410840 RepID=A0ABU0HAI1_9HYPH|nr:hypothetical protein [Kaistia dalseonensis]